MSVSHLSRGLASGVTRTVGVRFGWPEETRAEQVMIHEAEDLGNDEEIFEYAEALGVAKDKIPLGVDVSPEQRFAPVMRAMRKRFGNDPRVIWVCTDMDGLKSYSHTPEGEPLCGDILAVHVPSDSALLVDLGEGELGGQLWACRGYNAKEITERGARRTLAALKKNSRNTEVPAHEKT